MPIGKLAHTHLPYCIQRTTDGKWLALNRNYKPLGTLSREWVDYDTHPDRFALDGRTLSAIKRAATGEIESVPGDPGVIFFYDDGCMPTASAADLARYMKAVSLLMNARIKGD